MSKGKELSNVSIQYNKWGFADIVRDEMRRLLARLLNLADGSTEDKEKREALKGLMKDFLNYSYREIYNNLEDYVKDFGIIDKKEGQSIPPLGARPLEHPHD